MPDEAPFIEPIEPIGLDIADGLIIDDGLDIGVGAEYAADDVAIAAAPANTTASDRDLNTEAPPAKTVGYYVPAACIDRTSLRGAPSSEPLAP
jgi:hypothetical protein